jgi:glycosyltransferase involved in cell wall biosynthesis
MPTVSIIMAAYNAERFIGAAIRSVQLQTFEDWELVVINDGSTDETAPIVQAKASEDSRIRMIQQPNSGSPAAARNAGIPLARGRYLGFLDAYDRYEPSRLAAALEAFDRYPGLGFVFCDMYIEDGDGTREADTYLGQTGFFELEQLPGHVTVVGGSYVAVELVGIFCALGVKTRVVLRHDRPLRHFDTMLSEATCDLWKGRGTEVLTNAEVTSCEAAADGAILNTEDGRRIEVPDLLLWATGRTPNSRGIGLEGQSKMDLISSR